MTQSGIEPQSPKQLANTNHYANGPELYYRILFLQIFYTDKNTQILSK